MSFLDNLTGGLFGAPEIDEEDEAKKFGQLILAKEAQTGQRAEERDMLPVPSAAPVQRALEFFQSKGLSKQDAAAFVWNLTQESGPNLQTDLVHDGGTGLGIAGFRDPVPGMGRRTNLQKFAGTKNPNLDQQLEFMWDELNTTERRAMEGVLAAQTPEAKATAAIKYFRPALMNELDRAKRSGEVNAMINGTPMRQYADSGMTMNDGGSQEAVDLQENEELMPNGWIKMKFPEGEGYRPGPNPLTGSPSDVMSVGGSDKSFSGVNHTEDEGESWEPGPRSELFDESKWGPNIEEMWRRHIAPPGYVPPTPQQQAPERTVQEKVMGPVEQFAGNSLGAVAAIPHALGSLLYKPQAYIENTELGQTPIGKIMTGGATELVRGLEGSAQDAMAAGKKFVGAQRKPTGVAEELAALVGRNFTPAGRVTAPMSIASAGVDALNENIITSAQAATSQVAKDRAAAKKARKAEQQVQDVDHVVQTIGGPARIKGTELATLGGMAAVSIGAIFAPILFAKFKMGRLPKWRTVEEAAPGTVAISRNTDLARTADDANRGALNVLQRSGVNPSVVSEVERMFAIQTRSNANSIAEGAAQYGRANTPTFSFKSKVSLADIAKADAPDVRQYFLLRSQADELLLAGTAQSKLSPRKQALAGPPNINGATINDVLANLNALERANPQLRVIHAGFADVIKSQRIFAATGEYATLSKKENARLNAERSSHIPYSKNSAAAEQNPFQVQADEMKTRLRQRMENEAVGKYIDEMRKVEPGSFVRVNPKQLKDNPNWEKNTVTMWRRGKKEVYTTDPFLADVLKMDPYYNSSIAKGVLGVTKDVFTKTSTGAFAPWFATTSALRAWQQAKFTVDEGFRSPTLIGSVMAMPQQLYPQMAKHISERLQAGSNGLLGQIFPKPVLDGMSMRLAQAYDQSLYKQLQMAGGHEGSMWMQDNAKSANIAYSKFNQALKAAMPTVHGPANEALQVIGNLLNTSKNGYLATMNSIHNAPGFNFAKRNVNHASSMADLAERSKNLTGNPRVGGQFYAGDGKAIRMEGTNPVGRLAVNMYGRASEFGREAIPWFNIITQSTKKTGEAYLNNPAKFVGRAWLYSAMPAAAEFFYTRALDGLKDIPEYREPNGNSYYDYMMNGRSDTDRMLNWYIPIPGQPRENGIRVPVFQELAAVRFMMHTALDHASRSAVFSESEDFMRAVKAFGSVTVSLPMPPLGNTLLASQGMQGLYGFTGESYRRRQDPFDQSGGMPHGLELYARSLVPGIADVVGSGYAAYSATPTEDGMQKAFTNGLKEAGTKIVKKTAIVRDLAGLSPPASGNTFITEKMYYKTKAINQLERFMKQNVDDIGEKTDASKTGGMIAEKLLGTPIPREKAGLGSPAPTNPLYIMLAEEIHKKFKTDIPRDSSGNEQGGIGYKSLWKRYGDATAQIRSMRNINTGNFVTWTRQLAERPEQMKYLQENNVNYKDPIAVRNHYERVRQDAVKVILNTIKQVENQFSLRVGKPIKFEDIDPYGKGMPDTESGTLE